MTESDNEQQLDETVMKLSFRGAIYESPFPTLELIESPVEAYNNGIEWRFQHLKAVRSEQADRLESDEGNEEILLAIWEPAPTTDTRTRPFLFVAKHLLSTEEEAKAILSYYLEVYAKNPVSPPPRVFVGTKETETAKQSSPRSR